jgi:hypothetical protein
LCSGVTISSKRPITHVLTENVPARRPANGAGTQQCGAIEGRRSTIMIDRAAL